MDRVAGPQLFGVCFSYGGDLMENCAGKGAMVTVAVADGRTCASAVFVGAAVGVETEGVTGNAVGTGPTGSTTFFT